MASKVPVWVTLFVSVTMLMDSLRRGDCEVRISSSLKPDPPLPQERLHLADWSVDQYTFLYVSDPGATATDGTLMYLPTSVVSKMGTFRRPISRIMASDNIMRCAYSSSYAGSPVVSEPLPNSPTVVNQSMSPRGARLDEQFPEPTGDNPPKRVADLTVEDIIGDPRTAFILSGDSYGSAFRRTCFADPMATVSPVDYQLVRSLRAGSDSFEFSAKIGRGFGAALLSRAKGPPVETLTITRGKKLSILWPSYIPTAPSHSAPSTIYETYVLGSGLTQADLEYKQMVDLAGSVDESADHRFQSARMHATLLFFAANMDKRADPYIFTEIAVRTWMAAFSHVQIVMANGYASLSDIMNVEIDLRTVWTSAFPSRAFGGLPTSAFFEGGTPFSSLTNDLKVRALVTDAVKKVARMVPTEPNYLASVAKALRAAYAFPPTENGHMLSRFIVTEETSSLASSVMTVLYADYLKDVLELNVTVGHITFYSARVLLSADDANVERARRFLLLVTSMCSDTAAADSDVDVQMAYVSVWKHLKPFNVADVFSPCMVSLRLDYSSPTRGLLAALGASEKSTLSERLDSVDKDHGGSPAEEERLETAALRISERLGGSFSLHTLDRFLPEVTDCFDVETLSTSTVLIIPIAPGAAYVVTRRDLGGGLVYPVSGVSINNPLYITYTTGGCGLLSKRIGVPKSFSVPLVGRGTIDVAARLPRPMYGECPYCGCVVLQYDGSGTVAHAITVTSRDVQTELVASTNSSVRYFNPTASPNAVYGTTLLLFPNGTVVRLTEFDSDKKVALSAMYIISAVVGSLFALALLAVTIRMIVSAVSGSMGDGEWVKTITSKYKRMETPMRLSKRWTKQTYVAELASDNDSLQGDAEFGHGDDTFLLTTRNGK
nr:envelope glycoprotein H UL22 [Psittacid alphaherpesvirus 6]